MNKEKINCKIDYESKDSPRCRILVNNQSVHEFVGNGEEEKFSFMVDKGPFTLRILHHGKDMKRDVNKFIEVKKIYFNDIDIKGLLWQTRQVADIPHWQNENDFEWQSNLYLGHNGYIEYQMRSPIMDYLLEYHTKGAKVSSNMGSYNMDLLYEMKEYFSKIVKEQDEKQ